MNDTAALMLRIEALPAISDPAEALDVMAQVERLQAQAKELRRQLEEALIQFIDQHGDLELGDKRWYVGVDKSYKPRVEPTALLTHLMEATGGDFDRFCDLLSSGAFKPGACKKVLGEQFDSLFETVVRKDLETGKPRRVVKVVDERFAR